MKRRPHLVDRGVLCCMCGAVSDNGSTCPTLREKREPLQVEGANTRSSNRRARDRKFDTWSDQVNLDRVMNPLPKFAAHGDTRGPACPRHVSSFSAMKIDMDDLGIDVMLTGAQKALALPPGFCLFSASEKAFGRAEKIPNRGYYFDFLEFKKQQAEWMTQSTPSIGHIHALQSKLDEILDESFEARFARHARTRLSTTGSAARLRFLAEDGYRTRTSPA